MKNYLIYTLLLTVVIVGALLALNKLPQITVAGYNLRVIDILADVRKPIKEELPCVEIPDLLVDVDSVPEIDSLDINKDSTQININTLVDTTKVVKRIFANEKWVDEDTDEEGITHIVDYSDVSGCGMSPFYEALNAIKESEEYARIAVFGDSFIEADILTGDLRACLQSEYGGSGVGFVPITSETNGFRPTVIHNFQGWSSYSVTDTSSFKNKYQGVSGHYFIPEKSAFVQMKGQKRYGTHLDTCQVASIFFSNKYPLTLTSQINGGVQEPFYIEGSQELQSVVVQGSIGRVKWTILSDSTSVFYGTAMDGKDGVILDNFSLRGSSGYSLQSIPRKNIQEFNTLRPYNLIVLQYGLNVVSKKVYDYNYYRVRMNKVISYLKECFPQAGILLLSVGDRDYKADDGTYQTMPEIKYFLKIQRQIAKDNKIAFWNMFEAMGGESSMYDLVHDEPAKANFDYTHINFRGGRFLAKKLFESIKRGKSDFEKGEVYAGQ
mgnify:FL=1